MASSNVIDLGRLRTHYRMADYICRVCFAQTKSFAPAQLSELDLMCDGCGGFDRLKKTKDHGLFTEEEMNLKLRELNGEEAP